MVIIQKMSDIKNMLQREFKTLGLTDVEGLVLSSIYDGHDTASAISKATKVSRTRVYRVIERLLDQGFVVGDLQKYGSRFFPPESSALDGLLTTQRARLKQHESAINNLKGLLAELKKQTKRSSKVRHYKGQDGYKQVNWNSTKAKGALRIYELDNLTVLTEKNFAEEVRLEFSKKTDFTIFQLTNLKNIEDYTNISEILDMWEVRHLPKSVIDITSETMIYNDVVVTYEMLDNEVFIVETYNKAYAEMQKQIFDQIWNLAKPMKVISSKGKAIIES